MIPNGQEREHDVKQAIMDHIKYEKRNTAVIEVAFRHILSAGHTEPEVRSRDVLWVYSS